MPTIFEATFDGSNAVRYVHVPIVNFYLNAALGYAREAQEHAEGDMSLRRAVCAITFSAMTLEAFVNERSEDDIPSADKSDFDRMRRKYAKPPGRSSVTHKYECLLAAKLKAKAPPEIMLGLEDLMATRNMLVHYRPIDTACKYIMPPPKNVPMESGGMVVIDFMQEPLRIEPPFLNRINHATAAKSYNSVLMALRYWYGSTTELCGLERYPLVTPKM